MENIIVVCQYKIYKMEKIFFQFHHSNCKNIIDDEKYQFLLLLLFPDPPIFNCQLFFLVIQVIN